MRATIAKRFTFDAAHNLPMCPAEHKCHRLHGHTYTVEVTLVGPVKENGFVVDYDQIAEAWQPIHAKLDHEYLNRIKGLECPTTEVLAAWICRELVDGEKADLLGGIPLAPLPTTPLQAYRPSTLVTSVRVEESSSTWCVVLAQDAGCKRIVWSLAV